MLIMAFNATEVLYVHSNTSSSGSGWSSWGGGGGQRGGGGGGGLGLGGGGGGEGGAGSLIQLVARLNLCSRWCLVSVYIYMELQC